MPNAQGKRRRSTEGAEGTNKGRENAEGMALVGVRLTVQLGQAWARYRRRAATAVYSSFEISIKYCKFHIVDKF